MSSEPLQPTALFDMRSDLTDLDLSEASEHQFRRATNRLQGDFTPERGWSEEELLNYTLMLSLNEHGGQTAEPGSFDEEGDWDEFEDGAGSGRYRQQQQQQQQQDEWPSSYESVGSFGGRSRQGSRSWKLGTSISGPTSPTLRPVGGTTASSPRVGARRREELEDEELQFALQLSLVEK